MRHFSATYKFHTKLLTLSKNYGHKMACGAFNAKKFKTISYLYQTTKI